MKKDYDYGYEHEPAKSVLNRANEIMTGVIIALVVCYTIYVWSK